MPRVTFMTHMAKAMVHIDFDGAKPPDYPGIIEEALGFLCRYPPRSARVMTTVREARFDTAVMKAFESFVRQATPHCAANALVGVTGLRKVAFHGLKPFYYCASELFDAPEPAMDWLAAN